MLNNNLNIAIAKGKALMEKSNDAFHDFGHAENVEQIALAILNRQKRGVAVELVTITAYWHDIYKASKDRFYLSNIDGKGSSLIAKRELKNILSKKVLKNLLKSIADHDRVIKYILFPKSFSFLSKLLIEADMIDMFNISRWKRGVCSKNMTYPQKVAFCLFELIIMAFLLPQVFTFNKARQLFKIKSKKFWGFFLFKEKYFFKIIANKI